MSMITDDNNIKREDIKDSTSLSESERALIYYIRKLKWGNLEILVQNGRPVMIKQMLRTIKLIDTRSTTQ